MIRTNITTSTISTDCVLKLVNKSSVDAELIGIY